MAQGSRRRARAAFFALAAAALALHSSTPAALFVELPGVHPLEDVASQAFVASRRSTLFGTSVTLGVGAFTDKEPETDEEKLLDALYLISRMQEATVQQERFASQVKTQGTAKRDMSKALKLADKSYRLLDQIILASKYVPSKDLLTATQAGNDAIDAFEGAMVFVKELGNDGALSKEQRSFLMASMSTTREKLFDFLAFMPVDKVEQVRKIIEDENVDNRAAAATGVAEGAIDANAGVFNPVTLPWKKGFTPL